jgi:hypothetical protein
MSDGTRHAERQHMTKQLPIIALSAFVLTTVSGCGSKTSNASETGGNSGTGGGGPIAAASGDLSSHAGGGGESAGGSSGTPAGESGASSDAGSAGESGASGASGAPNTSPMACDEQLKALDLGPNATVTLVKSFPAGAVLSLTSPAAADAPVSPFELCLVKLTVGPGNPGPAGAPSTSSGIGLEIWLPTHANWNERYQAFGNGGFAGGPELKSLTAIAALRPGPSPLFAAGQGFVTSINDGGHSGIEGSFALNPDGSFNTASFDDFIERASHEMALKTKALIHAFYGRDPKYNYWNGCSEGGREGLMEVQRYPEDFDGVLAGAPAIYFDRLNMAGLWPQVVMQVDLGGPMAPAKLAAVTAAANAACSKALTGQPDGYISDPDACRYDPTTDGAVLCTSAGGTNTSDSCLTVVEAKAVNKIWYGPTSDGKVPAPATDNGRGALAALGPTQLWFGPGRGTLLAGHVIWDGVAGQHPGLVATDTLALALGDPTFAQPNFLNATGSGQDKWQTIGYAGTSSFASVFNASQARLGPASETANPNLGAFAGRGGRLLMWHGTSDSLIPSSGSVHYYEALAQYAGGYANAQQFARLYLGPGIDHCGIAGVVPVTNAPSPDTQGDAGPGLFDVLKTWLEDKQAPDQIAARSEPGVTPVRIRPWCAYPKKLKYLSGDVNTGNFSCE